MLDKRPEAVQAYLVAIRRALARGDSTEHTHRPALIDLVHALVKGIHCVNEPKGQKHGHPDIKVTLGETPIGYIETKDVGLDLAEIAESAQLRRYLREIPNLLLTDYLTFIWFENGHERTRTNLATLSGKDKVRAIEGQADALADLLTEFCRAELKTIASPKELAQRMASLARMTRRLIAEALAAEPGTGDLHAQLKAFREVLLPDIDETKFADMYAQTICYGLFAGICNSKFPQAFARENAADNLPPTNPFLRQLFHHIVGPELNEKVRSAVDQIVFLLRHADVQAILKDFGKRTRKEDPVVHFYETFLAEYDPKLRKSRGVYYTPEPIVSFIVRSVDYLLRMKLNKPMGVADPTVLTLDPATGTATFLHADVKLIYERVCGHGQYGAWSGYVRDNLLPRIFGFELLMAPYAVAHLKLGLLLHETEYDFASDERLGIYLTNTLEQLDKQVEFQFARWLSDESKKADNIKNAERIMVVLGNPPYSVSSANNGEWIRGLVRDYYAVDGQPLGERNPKSLQDDYVKFIRWGQWRIEKTGAGILAYISNNGYLDNPTFRGMRQQLMQTFTEIYILDLHGNSKKKETAPDGSKDENVFDIQQGVCIGIFVREPGKSGPAQVYHADVFGDRQSKYKFLLTEDIATVRWTKLAPSTPSYRFVPQDERCGAEYADGWPVPKVFPIGSGCMNTARDALVVDTDKAVLAGRLEKLRHSEGNLAEIAAAFGLELTEWWDFGAALERLRADDAWRSKLTRCLYRPFDVRWLYLEEAFIDRPRTEVNAHMQKKNISLVVTRQTKEPFDALVSSMVCGQHKIVAVYDRSFFYPLYAYGTSGDEYLFAESSTGGRRPNLSPKFVAEMEAKLGLKFVPEGAEDSLECGSKAAALSPSRSTGKAGAALPQSKGVFTPEDVFNYIYAIFHSPTYRKRYAEFLKIDFPRVPLTSDKRLFWKLVALGRELVALHLLESPKVNDFVTKYPKKGSDTVEKVQYVENPQITQITQKGSGKSVRSAESADGLRVYINDDQYFEGVKPEWFEFHIGGYQVLQKWLKDRKGRKLSNDDITHYQRVVVAIKETIRLMAEIDAAIPKWPVA